VRLAKAHGTIKSATSLRAARGHLLLSLAFVLTGFLLLRAVCDWYLPTA